VLHVVHIREAHSYLLPSEALGKGTVRLQVTSQPKKVTFVTLLADETIHPRYEEELKHVEREFGKHHTMFIDGRQVLAGGEFEYTRRDNWRIRLWYYVIASAKFSWM